MGSSHVCTHRQHNDALRAVLSTTACQGTGCVPQSKWVHASWDVSTTSHSAPAPSLGPLSCPMQDGHPDINCAWFNVIGPSAEVLCQTSHQRSMWTRARCGQHTWSSSQPLVHSCTSMDLFGKRKKLWCTESNQNCCMNTSPMANNCGGKYGRRRRERGSMWLLSRHCLQRFPRQNRPPATQYIKPKSSGLPVTFLV